MSDNGIEYISARFEEFCIVACIEHQLTAPTLIEQKGVSERKNKRMMEMARCLAFERNLPKKF